MNRQKILAMEVDATDMSNALLRINEFISSKTSAYVCLSNVHICMEVLGDPVFKEVVNNADLILPDGKPLSLAQKIAWL